MEIKSVPEDTGATCRYGIENAILISNNWKIGHEEKHPILDLKWIQGQQAASLLFVEVYAYKI